MFEVGRPSPPCQASGRGDLTLRHGSAASGLALSSIEATNGTATGRTACRSLRRRLARADGRRSPANRAPSCTSRLYADLPRALSLEAPPAAVRPGRSPAPEQPTTSAANGEADQARSLPSVPEEKAGHPVAETWLTSACRSRDSHHGSRCSFLTLGTGRRIRIAL